MKSKLLFLLALLHIGAAYGQARYWPKQIELKEFVITIYTPELENFEDNVLDARAAFSMFDREHLPVFGAMWFRCNVHEDESNNQAFFTNIKLMNAEFPNANAENVGQLQEIIQYAAPEWSFNTNLADFREGVKTFNVNNLAYDNLRNHPPVVFYEQQPSVLVFIDGEPIMANFSGTELYQYVVNTPHFILKSKSDSQYYLKGGDWWYVSENPTLSWKPISTPPAHIKDLAEKSNAYKGNNKQESTPTGLKQPKLIVTTEPAELIQTNGEPQIEQIYENLFSISNSQDQIIFDSRSDYYFILLSGRWFKSKKLRTDRWQFVPPMELPKVFGEIPPSSSFAHLRLHVPGTPEAISAALDNGIPQTAVVDRKKAQMQAVYDGDPRFEEIEGTNLQYAVNSMASVIKTPERFYAVDQAIWFVADDAAGPWNVSDHIPQDVKKIPPTYPVYNMKFVYIYDYSENVVFTGYTGGYLGTFLYQGILCYGTGFKYKSWYGNSYIPRPSTYGYGTKKQEGKSPNISFHAAVGPWGPSMGVGFGGYPYGWGWGMGYGGFWPYGMYGYNMMNNVAYNQYYYSGQTDKVYADVVEEKPIDLQNIYKNRQEGILNTETVIRNDPMKPIILNDSDLPNHLYADQNGNIYRQDEVGDWYEQHGNNWRKIQGSPVR